MLYPHLGGIALQAHPLGSHLLLTLLEKDFLDWCLRIPAYLYKKSLVGHSVASLNFDLVRYFIGALTVPFSV